VSHLTPDRHLSWVRADVDRMASHVTLTTGERMIVYAHRYRTLRPAKAARPTAKGVPP